MSNSFILLIDRTLSDATTLGQSEPGSNGNEWVLHIFQSPRTRASQSDSLMSYPGHSTEMKSVYSTALLDVYFIYFNKEIKNQLSWLNGYVRVKFSIIQTL